MGACDGQPGIPGEVHLVCPGLRDGPVPDFAACPDADPPLPVLARLLASAAREPDPWPEPETALLAYCGIRCAPEHDLPTAVIELFADYPELAREGYWLHADPVHLHPGLNGMSVFAAMPGAAETTALVAHLNDDFAAAGEVSAFRLLATGPAHWYLRSDAAPPSTHPPLRRALGHHCHIDPPSGPGAGDWLRRLAEAEMLLNAAPVNQVRQRDGRPAINGLWTWGGGRLPRPLEGLPRLVVGDHPLARGLARLTGAAHRTPSQWCAEGCPATGAVPLFWNGFAAPAAGSLQAFEALCAALEDALLAGRLRRLWIEPGGGLRYAIMAGRFGLVRRLGERLGRALGRMPAPNLSRLRERLMTETSRLS